MAAREAVERGVSVFVVGAAVVCFWRGVWELIEENVFPDDLRSNGWACVSGALSVVALAQGVELLAKRFALAEEEAGEVDAFLPRTDGGEGMGVVGRMSGADGAIRVRERRERNRRVGRLCQVLLGRAVSLLWGVGGVLFWQGGWHLQDHYLFPHNRCLSIGLSIAFGTTVLLCLNSFASAHAPPLAYAADSATAPQLTGFSPLAVHWSVSEVPCVRWGCCVGTRERSAGLDRYLFHDDDDYDDQDDDDGARRR